ncbi:hypothetical protein TNCV_1305151 [Trichonephila clavipes]|nr:hypothetical protein TNCV_1305151 [Trichonephila clavipes]
MPDDAFSVSGACQLLDARAPCQERRQQRLVFCFGVAKFNRRIQRDDSRQYRDVTIQHKTWDCKPRLVIENCDNICHRDNDEPDEESGQTNAEGHLKSLVYETMVTALEDLMVRIVVASADIVSTTELLERVQQFFVRWLWLCYYLRGRTSKQFI